MEKLSITIDIKESYIDIEYDGYNIIAKTIYDERFAKKLVKLLEQKCQDEFFDTLENITKLEW